MILYPAARLAFHPAPPLQDNSQTELDAQLAERLMREEQDAAAREYEAASARGRSQQQQQQQQNQGLPYQPRRTSRRRSGERLPAPPPEPSLQDQFRDFISPRRDPQSEVGREGTGGPSAGGSGGINTAELQEQFSKFADSKSSCIRVALALTN